MKIILNICNCSNWCEFFLQFGRTIVGLPICGVSLVLNVELDGSIIQGIAIEKPYKARWQQ